MKFIILLSFVLSANAFASSYTCNDVDSSHGSSPINLDVISRGSVQIDGDEARLDSSYDPKFNNDYFRFHLTSDLKGMYGDYLISQELLEGASQGYLKFEDKSEAFVVGKFKCLPR